jgi:beta-N-acetylhexosaminidase
LINSKLPVPLWFLAIFIVTLVVVVCAMLYLGSGLLSLISDSPGPPSLSTPVENTTNPVPTNPSGDQPTPTLLPVIAEPPTSPPFFPTETLAPQPSATPPPITPAPDPWIEQTLAGMSLEQRIGQMLMVGVDGQAITPATCQLINRITPGGVVYRTGNAASPQALRRFSNGLQKCASQAGSLPLWISIDHEGQYVNRFETGATVFPAALALGAAANSAEAAQVASASGSELAFSGVNMVLGPVADVLTDYDNTVISQRSYGGDPQLVSQYVSQAVKGYLQAGVEPVLKHFPGHGGTSGDTHYVLATDPADLAQLQASHLPPFESGIQAGTQVVLTSHVAFPNIDNSGLPTTLSPVMLDVLRKTMGFQGVILTDSLGMAAVTNENRGISQAALMAVNAGVDMLLVTSPDTAQTVYNHLLVDVQKGDLTEARINESVRRILTAKAARGLKSFDFPTSSTPNWNGNQDLALQVGANAVTVMRDDAQLVPLPTKDKSIMIVGPADGWGLYPALKSALGEKGFHFTIYPYSNPWGGAVPEAGYLTSLPAQAHQFDLVLVFTWDSHPNRFVFDDNWQSMLVKRMQKTGVPLVVVALKSPTDILDFPDIPTYLTTFGTTDGQIHTLAGVLAGDTQATGVNPLPGLMP